MTATLTTDALGEAHAVAPTAGQSGRVGPNAVTQLGAALADRLGGRAAERIFAAAGLRHHLATPPDGMVDEREVAALQRALRDLLPSSAADAVLAEAGRRTGAYLLANRIPRPAQTVLRLLPAALAERVLVNAIGRHAWTFVGSGSFRAFGTRPLLIEIEGCPLCRDIRASDPVCMLYAQTFAYVFRALVSSAVECREVACAATGAPACRFEISR